MNPRGRILFIVGFLSIVSSVSLAGADLPPEERFLKAKDVFQTAEKQSLKGHHWFRETYRITCEAAYSSGGRIKYKEVRMKAGLNVSSHPIFGEEGTVNPPAEEGAFYYPDFTLRETSTDTGWNEIGRWSQRDPLDHNFLMEVGDSFHTIGKIRWLWDNPTGSPPTGLMLFYSRWENKTKGNSAEYYCWR